MTLPITTEAAFKQITFTVHILLSNETSFCITEDVSSLNQIPPEYKSSKSMNTITVLTINIINYNINLKYAYRVSSLMFILMIPEKQECFFLIRIRIRDTIKANYDEQELFLLEY